MSTAALAATPDRPGLFAQAMLLLTITFIIMLYAMTVTIANVSLPQMQGSLSSTPDQIAWIITFNIVATAIVTPIAGWLAARLGRRRLMIYGIVGFGVSSVLCGLATSVPELVIYRIGQGAFGAPLVPLGQAILIESFEARQRAKVMSVMGIGVMMGPILAPVLGGILSEAYGWRWVFFMLVPSTIVALLMVLIFIKRRSGPRGEAKLDVTGFLAFSVAITALQLMLDRGERLDWFESFEIVIYACVLAAALWVAIVRNAQSPNPFVNPALLRDRNFALGLALIFIFGMLNYVPVTLLPTMLQSVQGYPDSIIGQVLSARGVGTFVAFSAMFFAGGLDPRIPISVGMVLQAWSGWIMAGFSADVMTSDVLWAAAIQGVGVGLVWVPLSVVAFATLDPKLVPDGTAIFHLLRNFGSSVFISISIALVIRESRISYAELVPNVSPFSEAWRQPGVPGLDPNDPDTLIRFASEIGRQSLMIGNLDGFILFAAAALVALPLVACVKRRRDAPARVQIDPRLRRRLRS